MANHLKSIARTVMVPEVNVEGAYRTLNRILLKRWRSPAAASGRAVKHAMGSTAWKWLQRLTP